VFTTPRFFLFPERLDHGIGSKLVGFEGKDDAMVRRSLDRSVGCRA